MSFFTGSNEALAQELINTDMMVALAPDYYGPRLDAIKELRDLDDGTLHKGSEFRRVASFINVPLFNAMTTVLDPEFMKDRKKFYAWLDEHREYCTYQRRDRATALQMVQRDIGNLGKEVANGGLLPAAESGQPQEG